MAGVADMVSQTTEGIRNTPEYIAKRETLTRMRLPRVWEKGGAVRGYDKRQVSTRQSACEACATLCYNVMHASALSCKS
jgi:hypothetical protein